jgi:Flp pilus assembly protein CpaB
VASLIPAGLRAFAVPTSLPRGAVREGDRVDILATYGTGGAGQPHTEMVVGGVEILYVLGPGAVGPSAPGASALDIVAEGDATTLIILVSPDQESRLAYARAFANLEVAIAPATGGG